MAVANYHDTHGQFPPPYLADETGRPMHSWRVLILPFIEGNAIYEQYDFTEPWDGPNNRKLADRMPSTFAFSGEPREGNTTTNYLAVVGRETVWQVDQPVTYKDITDGSSNTIFLVENQGAKVHWMEPRDLRFDEMDFTLDSPRGVSSKYRVPSVAMLDGSVRSLSMDVRPNAIRAAFTIRGNESLRLDGEPGVKEIDDGRQRPLKEPNDEQ